MTIRACLDGQNVPIMLWKLQKRTHHLPLYQVHYYVECVPHDRDKHVQEGDLRDERREDEQNPKQSYIRIRLESICLELSNIR